MTRFAFSVVYEFEGDTEEAAYEALGGLIPHDGPFVAAMSSGREIPEGWFHEGDKPEGTHYYTYDVSPPAFDPIDERLL